MNQTLYRSILSMLLLTTSITKPVLITTEEINQSVHEKQINLTIALEPTQTILTSSLSVSIDNPHAQLGTISYSATPIQQYLPELLSSKEVFNDTLIVNVPVKVSIDTPVKINLHTSFLLLPQGIMTEKIVELSFNEPTKANTVSQTQNLPEYPTTLTTSSEEKKSLTKSLQHLVQTTDSNWIRFLFALLLGLLLSLTPCIYPMIPITIGILHHNEKRSVLYNFLGSLCYAFGLSTTFAGLGLLAAFAGASFGGLLSQPIFVIVMVLFIGYMSLTMIGVIDLAIPSFLQKSVQVNSKFGPFLSAYLFGLISGSVASPCVSPGLALLLTIVATMGNVFAGFLLLFMFGMGMSVPLIIIGTFSSSMQTLPRAGQWMVEIKKGLGFVMLATCFYYLSNILPSTVVGTLFTCYLVFAALFYIIDAQKEFAKERKTIKSLLGIALLAFAVFFSFKVYENIGQKNIAAEQGVSWASNYQEALASAQAESKVILLDFWANHCTICKAIDKKIFHKDVIAKALQGKVVFLKVDCTSSTNQEANYLKTKFNVFAQPAILIINPHTQEVVQKWSSEPYSMTTQEFIDKVCKAL